MSITIKLVNGKDIRRASFPRDVSFESFQKKAKSSFTFNKREEEYLVCKYQDDEGDLVTIGDQSDFEEALEILESLPSIPKIYLQFNRASYRRNVCEERKKQRERWAHALQSRSPFFGNMFRAMYTDNTDEKEKVEEKKEEKTEQRKCPAVSSFCSNPYSLYSRYHYKAMGELEEGTPESLKKSVASLEQQVEVVMNSGLPQSYLRTPYYNLACAYSLLKNLPEALTYLHKAIHYGWHDYEHTRTDSDLNNLHGHPEFEKILKSLKGESVEEEDKTDEEEQEEEEEEEELENVKIEDDVEEEEEVQQIPEVPSTRLSSTAEFETKLAQLEEMGWSDRRQNIKALLNAKGDVVEAVESLLLL